MKKAPFNVVVEEAEGIMTGGPLQNVPRGTTTPPLPPSKQILPSAPFDNSQSCKIRNNLLIPNPVQQILPSIHTPPTSHQHPPAVRCFLSVLNNTIITSCDQAIQGISGTIIFKSHIKKYDY